MDVILTTFLAGLLAEWGDKTQLLVVALALRFRQPLPILAGVALGALANALIAAGGGVFIHGMITVRAVSLLVALALVFAGVAGLISQNAPDMASDWKSGALVTTTACFFLLEFADKTQFLTFALAAQFNSLVLAGLGATCGVVAANAPAAFLADRLPAIVPLKPLRLGIAALFLVGGFIVAVNALRLL
jgi:putative Ca2+/H+ antiporter (TMEM165/GDT1 family)